MEIAKESCGCGSITAERCLEPQFIYIFLLLFIRNSIQCISQTITLLWFCIIYLHIYNVEKLLSGGGGGGF